MGSKLISVSEDVYNRLTPYTNNLPNRHKRKSGYSTAIKWLLDFKDGIL